MRIPTSAQVTPLGLVVATCNDGTAWGLDPGESVFKHLGTIPGCGDEDKERSEPDRNDDDDEDKSYMSPDFGIARVNRKGKLKYWYIGDEEEEADWVDGEEATSFDTLSEVHEALEKIGTRTRKEYKPFIVILNE
jgi:hypothetical protein